MQNLVAINKVINAFFEQHAGIDAIPAKDLMPYFIKAGIFPKDEKKGLPIRKVLRELDKVNQLDKIHFAIAVRKAVNTNWFFGRSANIQPVNFKVTFEKINQTKKIKTNNVKKRCESDEHYVIDLCDEVLGLKGSRQHTFDFLRGDEGKNGSSRKLPVDVYYEKLKLVIEFNEQQHSKAVKHFDKPNILTISGVHRGEQRKIYDQRKRTLLPQHGINALDLSYHLFQCSRGKIIRDEQGDIDIVKRVVNEFLDHK